MQCGDRIEVSMKLKTRYRESKSETWRNHELWVEMSVWRPRSEVPSLR